MEKLTKAQQLLFRFYKEKKIYKKYKHRNNIVNCDFFDKNFSWYHSDEGHKYWLCIQCDFIIFLFENDKEGVLGDSDTLRRSFKNYLTNGYFLSYMEKNEIYTKYNLLYNNMFKKEN